MKDYVNSPRIREIRGLNPIVFDAYLENLDENDIKYYENAMFINRKGYSSNDRICRENTINNFISTSHLDDTFTLKLMELAMLFPSQTQWESFACGDDPLNNLQIANAFDTTEENVVMKKNLDLAISAFKKNESKVAKKVFN